MHPGATIKILEPYSNLCLPFYSHPILDILATAQPEIKTETKQKQCKTKNPEGEKLQNQNSLVKHIKHDHIPNKLSDNPLPTGLFFI